MRCEAYILKHHVKSCYVWPYVSHHIPIWKDISTLVGISTLNHVDSPGEEAKPTAGFNTVNAEDMFPAVNSDNAFLKK